MGKLESVGVGLGIIAVVLLSFGIAWGILNYEKRVDGKVLSITIETKLFGTVTYLTLEHVGEVDFYGVYSFELGRSYHLYMRWGFGHPVLKYVELIE